MTRSAHPLPPPAVLGAFRRRVLDHYRRHARDLPWRRTRDPYAILVSEFMLQQTQVDRVLGRFALFLERFPSFAALASAPVAEVLRAWQGLGYNRRALNLHRVACRVVAENQGRLPDSPETLRTMPGIGPATTAAVMAFAFDRPLALIETNIRAVFIHHFFPGSGRIADAAILPLVEATISRRDPRTWYYALMDYGTALKRGYANPARRSLHHARQAPFEGSNRQLRGRVLRLLLQSGARSAVEIGEITGQPLERLMPCLLGLAQDGLIRRQGRRYRPA